MEPNFDELIKPYLKNKTYLKLNKCQHHNTTRLNHVYNVAVYSYWIGKKLNVFCDIDFEALLTGAMLHDFFFTAKLEKGRVSRFVNHCELAEENASKYFYISEKERNIILSHMFPFARYAPHSKEAWIVTIADKWSALLEACFNKNHTVPIKNI